MSNFETKLKALCPALDMNNPQHVTIHMVAHHMYTQGILDGRKEGAGMNMREIQRGVRRELRRRMTSPASIGRAMSAFDDAFEACMKVWGYL